MAFAQAPEQGDEVPEIKAIVGAPFSAVSVQENIQVTSDGNRFIHRITAHHYRDGQGRTRLERGRPVPVGATDSPGELDQSFVFINNKVTGEVATLFPQGQVATVVQRTRVKVVDEPVTLPEIYTSFAGLSVGTKDPGCSAPTSLGEKSLEGVHVVGSQKIYTVPVGKVGNEKPVTITVEQWSSPELGIIVDKTMIASTGGRSHYHLTQLVQAEPDPAVFKVPAHYKTTVVKTGTGHVMSAQSTITTTTSAR